MKGIMFKAFSLALLLSVVPSFAMEVKSAAEVPAMQTPAMPAPEVTTAELVAAVGAPIAQGFAIDVVKQSAWEQVKAAAASLASNSYVQKAMGVTATVLAAPFDYTVGLVSNKSGLTAKVSGYDFVKNNSYYNQSIAKGAKYLAGVTALYYAGKYAVKGVKAAYGYLTAPSEAKKSYAVVAKDFKSIDAVIAQLVELATDLANPKVTGFAKKYAELSQYEMLAGCGYNKAQKATVSVELADDSYCSVIMGHLKAVDSNNKNRKSAIESVQQIQRNLMAIAQAERKNAMTVVAKKDRIAKNDVAIKASMDKLAAVPVKAVVKATTQAEVAPSYARRAYNMLFNRYTAGLAVIGAGATGYVYKYGVPSFLNRTK